MLKSVIVRRTNELPPRLHQLVRLAEVAGVAIDERQVDFLRELSAYYIPTRYPEEAADHVIASEARQSADLRRLQKPRRH